MGDDEPVPPLPDVGAPYVAPPPAGSFLDEVGRDPGRLRVGYTTRSILGQRTDPACARACDDAVRLLEKLGHEVSEVALPIDATGWYPVVDRDEQVFVRVARERTPAPDGTWTDFLRVAQLARLGAQGLTSAVGGVPNGAWFLAGTVIEPAWCRENTSIRCGRFTIDGDVITDGTFGFAWMGGAWPTTGEPPRSVTAPGARWLYVGQWEGAGPPRDPSRQVPLTEMRVQPVPAAH